MQCSMCSRVQGSWDSTDFFKNINGIFCTDCLRVMSKIGRLYYYREKYFKKRYAALYKLILNKTID